MLQIPDDFVHASFFFVDIVGLSNPITSTETQKIKIKILNDFVAQCPTFTNTENDEMMILPSGDGMSIGFKNRLDGPIKLAIELHEKLFTYNRNKEDIEKIFVRIGCHN